MLKKDFPILEFDADRNALIRPERNHKPIENIPKNAVLCFFADAIEKILADYPHEIITHLRGEGLVIPVYGLDYGGEKIALVQAIVGAPLAAAQIEELTAYGCQKYIACGVCGVLRDIAVGHLIVPTAAVRDEGTSYHYAPPSREISVSGHAVRVIEAALREKNAPFITGKTWTTDAFFRETPAKVQLRREEGCIAVEMETSAFAAAAKYNDVEFGQILYAGDSLAGEAWDGREWNTRADIRESVLKLAIEACLRL